MNFCDFPGRNIWKKTLTKWSRFCITTGLGHRFLVDFKITVWRKKAFCREIKPNPTGLEEALEYIYIYIVYIYCI